MSLLLTGASGFVGLNLIERLLRRGCRVISYASTPIPPAALADFAGLPGSLIEIAGDVRDPLALSEVVKRHAVRRVAHMAAITAGPDRERLAAEAILSVNLVGLAAVLTAVAPTVERFLYVGSIAVFGGGGADGSIVDEDFPHHPRTLYAITKSTGEAVLARLAGMLAVDAVVGRLGRVFGPWEYDTGVRDTLSQVYQVTMAARAGEAVVLPRPCRKNWSYARDAAADLETLLMTPTHRHPVYNLGSPQVWPLSDWCARLAGRYPQFRYTVGDGDGKTIDLGGDTDGGLLSWQRYSDEFGPPARHDVDAAFTDYMNYLDSDTARSMAAQR